MNVAVRLRKHLIPTNHLNVCVGGGINKTPKGFIFIGSEIKSGCFLDQKYQHTRSSVSSEMRFLETKCEVIWFLDVLSMGTHLSTTRRRATLHTGLE